MLRTNSARLQLVLAAALFSTGGAAIKAASLTGYQVAGFRSGIAALTLFLLLPAARRGYTWRSLAVGVAYAATLLLFVLANKLTTSANTIYLQSTAPLYILLLAPLLLKEPIRLKDLWFMAAIAAGMILFFVTRQEPLATAPNPRAGDLLAALSGLTYGLTVMGLRWLARGPERGSQMAAMVMGNALVFLVVLPVALPVAGASLLDWGVVTYLGVVQIGVAYMFLARGLEGVPAFEASLLLLVEPALNPVWSWLALGERPSGWAIVGAVIILGATTLRTWVEARQARVLARVAPAP
jgi:drug/metabolite transporter (DMT)-like permease